MKKFAAYTFIITLSILAGVILSAQILAFLNLYYPIPVLLLSVVLSTILTYGLIKLSYPFIYNVLTQPDRLVSSKWVARMITVAAILLFLVVLFLPLLLWPYSSINSELNWDAGLYHFPKAAEMVVTHSSWDLTIPYGEYPYGFESLIAASLLISPGGTLIGLVHALILLFFTLGLTLLVLRYSRMPVEYAFFLVVALVASYDIVQSGLNPFGIFRILAFTIGKNDFFLAAAMMAFLFFSPMAPDFPKRNLAGLALSSALVACIKPNGLLLLGVLWAFVIVLEIGQFKQHGWQKKALWMWVGIITLQIVAVLWVVRNLLVQHTLISDESIHLQQNSILQNLTNPLFTHSLGMLSGLFLVTLLALTVAAFFFKKVHFSIPLTFLLLLFSFVVTPATLYFGASGQDEATLFWRLGVYLFAFEVPALFLLIDPLLVWVLNNKNPRVRLALNASLAAVFALLSLFTSYRNFSRLIPVQGHDLVLRDQYQEPVGVDGYFSAYDYVRKNISHAVIWVENGLPFYVYGNPLTNSTTHQRAADYRVFFATNWIGTSGFPAMLDSSEWTSQWQLVYADPEGRVYKNLNPDK